MPHCMYDPAVVDFPLPAPYSLSLRRSLHQTRPSLHQLGQVAYDLFSESVEYSTKSVTTDLEQSIGPAKTTPPGAFSAHALQDTSPLRARPCSPFPPP